MQKTDLEREFIRREIGKPIIFLFRRAQEEGVLTLYPVDKEKITRVGMGYNNSDFFIWQRKAVTKEGVTSLVFAGKIAEKKGVKSLLRAMAL